MLVHTNMQTRCIFCHGDIQVGNKNYIFHLGQYHRIKFDLDHVLERSQELLEIQRTRFGAFNMNTSIAELVNDIVKNVTENSENKNALVNESNEYSNNNQISDFLCMEPENSDNEGFDDNVSETSSLDQDEGTDKDSSTPSKLLDNSAPPNNYILNSISRINDIKSLLEGLCDDESSDESMNVSIANNNLFDKKHSDLSLNYSTLPNSWKTDLGEINVDFHIKIEEMKKEPLEINDCRGNTKRSYENAFSEELNSIVTSRRKSARLGTKTQKANILAEGKDLLEPSEIETESAKIVRNEKGFRKEPEHFKLSQVKTENIENTQVSKYIVENPNYSETSLIQFENTEILQKDVTNIELIQNDTFVQSGKEWDTLQMTNLFKVQKNGMPSNLQHIPWYHGTIYSCQLCSKQFLQKRKFKMHMESSHDVQYENYEEKSTRSNIHECEICGKGFQWSKNVLASHLSGKHDISLNKYYEKFEDIIELPNLQITDETLLSKFDFMGKQDNLNSSKYPYNVTNPDNDWSNRCIFQCGICQKEFNSRIKFKLHLKTEHKKSLIEYRKDYGKSVASEEIHVCQICGASMIWDKTSIYNHLTHNHQNMTLEDYATQYMHNYSEKIIDSDWANKCKFKCNLCEKELDAWNKLGHHLKSQHHLSLIEYSKDHGVSMSHSEKHSCQIEDCNAYIWWNKQTIKSHLNGVHNKMSLEKYKSIYMNNYAEKKIDDSASLKTEMETSRPDGDYEWANQCTFQCTLCLKEFNSKSKFGTHLKSHHQLSLKEYTKVYGKSILHEEKHYCQFESCDTAIIWDRSSILGHLRNVHDLVSIEDYKEKYMDNYVKKSPQENEVEYLDRTMDTETDNEWSNKCIYLCALCQTEFKSRIKFGKHLKSQHEVILSEYIKDHGISMTHQEKHGCQVESCKSIIWWDKKAIKAHLYNVHNKMSIDEYKDKYMGNYVENKNKRAKKVTSWTNRCIYNYTFCGSEFNVHKFFDNHLKSEHKITIKEYSKQFGRTMSYEEKHQCQVESCTSFVWWDWRAIYNHLAKLHEKMTVDEYEEKYMPNYEGTSKKLIDTKQSLSADRYSECQFSCNICKPGKTFNSRSKTGTHMKRTHGINLKQYKQQHGSSISYKINHTCHICAATLLWDRGAITTHLYGVHDQMPISEYFEKFIDNCKDDTEWLNKVILGCKECSKEQMFSTKIRASLWKHVNESHNMTEIEYRSVHWPIYGHGLPESHDCQICFDKVNWESISLKPHIELKHRMTLEQYVAKFKDSYKKKEGIKTKNNKPKINRPVQKNMDKKEDEDEEVLKWTTGSLYLCKICDKGMTGLCKFKKHLENRHNTDYKQYEKTYEAKDFILFSGFHICAKCQKNVRHDKLYLQSHMKEHNLTIRQYMDNYKPRPPKLERMMRDRQSASVN